MAPEAFTHSNLTLRVSNFIDSQSRTWCVDKLLQAFQQSDVTRILNLPLCSRDVCDVQVWCPNKNGIFSVKTAYWLGRCGHDRSLHLGFRRTYDIWKVVWQIQAPPKVRNFGWRCCSNMLSVKANLFAKRIVDNPICDSCG